ncbi:hypothetical protein K457DRAFT_27604 [Linnemannia elongata AG-77]|uniref:Uncharacterized protein n=1 Tax=Linnemannia elongata AG-77 TaxID=1314771 RepID=A0A197KDV3_9FUNG|nr:hypothetical protein K457DRAFT_27604 [Linnemannia elongata AG-77]
MDSQKRLRSSKRKGSGPQCKVDSNNDDEEEEGYSSDGTASLAATQKNVWSAYSNDGEDKDDRAASTMTLVDLWRRGCEIAYLLDRAHASNSNADVERDWIGRRPWIETRLSRTTRMAIIPSVLEAATAAATTAKRVLESLGSLVWAHMRTTPPEDDYSEFGRP